MMDNQVLFWFAMTLLCIFLEAFFAMGEIAIISFNKVRLQYYVNKKIKRAEWIYKLLQKPANLFGTVLLGVNIALQVGSECARQFYLAAGLDPNIAPISQFILVVIIAELAPLFAGRRYAEHVSMIESPLIYASSKLMAPVVFIFGLCVKIMNTLFHSQEEELGGVLSRDELQRVVEEHDDTISYTGESEEFNVVVANIFHLRSKTVKQVMIPLAELKMVSSACTVLEFRNFLKEWGHSRIPIYHRLTTNIVGIAQVRDLVRQDDRSRIKEAAKSPWFITENAKIIQILNEFRRNNQEMAIVLDSGGRAIGMLTLDDILDEIFHKDALNGRALHSVIDRRFFGNMKIKEFNKEFHAHLKGAETLEELILSRLEHHPEVGDSIRINRFELTVEECTFRSIKSISVKTLL